LLGAVILQEIQEEMKTGIALMVGMQNAATHLTTRPLSAFGLLPIKSWSGMKTIPDKVILRIIATNPSVNIKIRSDCKNYFEHVCGGINALISRGDPIKVIVERFINPSDRANHLIAAVNLNDDIEVIKTKCLHNAHKWRPL
jgi:hypothetical protein